MKHPELEVSSSVTLQLVTQCYCPDTPSGHHLISLLSALAFVFQVHPAAEWGTDVAMGEYSLLTLGTYNLKQFWMLQVTANKGSEPYRVRSNLGDPAHAVGHLHVERDEVETVVVLPVIETGIDLVRVDVEQFGEETLLLGRAQSGLTEEIVLVHDTDFF